MLAGLGAGAGIGALNGALVAYARLPSFLVTLATMGVFAGVGRRLTALKSVPIENDLFNGLFGSGAAVRRALAVLVDAGGGGAGAITVSPSRASARMCWRPATIRAPRAPPASPYRAYAFWC